MNTGFANLDRMNTKFVNTDNFNPCQMMPFKIWVSSKPVASLCILFALFFFQQVKHTGFDVAKRIFT